MSGKAKKPAKLANREAKPPAVKVTKVIEFQRGPKGTLRPKARWERDRG